MKKLVITLLAAALSLPIAFAQAPTTTEKPAKKTAKTKKVHKSKKQTKTETDTTAAPAK